MTSHFQAIVIRNDTEPLRLSAPGQWDEVKKVAIQWAREYFPHKIPEAIDQSFENIAAVVDWDNANASVYIICHE